MTPDALSVDERRIIVALARDSIRHGLEVGRALVPEPRPGGPLALPGACFVSLHIGDDLRGCIGQTEPARTLAEQIADHAYAAAFRDPRFPPLTRDELGRLSIEVHVLGPLEPLAFAHLDGLCAQLRAGIDGLQLEAAERRGVFLPVMWRELPAPHDFVAQLMRKAGIREITGIAASRFTAEIVAEPALGA